MTPRVAAMAVVVVVLAAVVAPAGPAVGETPSGDVSWVSTGDSYSSGEGVAGNQGPCAQSDLAYGPRAAVRARDAGWNITAEAFTACTDHLVEDLFNRRPGVDNAALWDWGLEQGAPDRVDLLTFSFGGNDIGFADLLIDCLPLPDSFTNAVTGIFRNDSLDVTGCDTPEQEVNARIAALLDPPRRGCEGGRQADRLQDGPGYDCDLLIDDWGDSDPGNDLRGTLVDFYVYLANEHLTDRGHIVVAGYPNLFAPVGEWPRWKRIQCQGIGRGDTERLGRLSANLDDTLVQAVRAANDQLGRDRIQYLPRSIIYRDGSHELCGTGEDWLNGVSIDRGDGTVRKDTSFHPNAAGHAATAAGLITQLEPLRFDPDVEDIDFQNTTFPANSCGQDSWSSPPIMVASGEGTAGGEYADDDLSQGYAEVHMVTVVGYSDLDGDGQQDVVVQLGCSSGGTYGDQIVVPLTLDGDALAFVGGGSIGAVSTAPEHLGLNDAYGGQRLARIISASLDGSDIVVHETYDATGDECQGCQSGRATIRWSWTGSAWSPQLEG